jgi:hypothetical protein
MCQSDVGIDINLETPLLKTWCWKLKVTELRKHMKLTLVRMGEISKLAIKGCQRNINTYAIPEHLKSINGICP